jgi:hypothetical protein
VPVGADDGFGGVCGVVEDGVCVVCANEIRGNGSAAKRRALDKSILVVTLSPDRLYMRRELLIT